jgi:hypothetical protein
MPEPPAEPLSVLTNLDCVAILDFDLAGFQACHARGRCVQRCYVRLV